MPTYQYRCTECGSDLEAVQKFTDPALTECPACGGSLRKVFNAVGVVFKGSGFYRTDSRAGAANGSSEKALEGGGEKSDAGKPGEKSGDKSGDKAGEKSGKPAEKPAAKGADKKSEAKQPAKAGA